MLSCKEIVHIMSSDQELKFSQKLELRAHLFMCKHCSAYSKQLKAIAIQLRQNFRNITKTDPEHVRDLEKKIIQNAKKSGNSGQ
jgi:NMD protein affecting ribosome stability and mRNA decay